MKYRIHCVVSGGVTGYRESWLKQGGVIYEVASKAAAITHAAHLNKEANGPHATARFSYTVVEMP